MIYKELEEKKVLIAAHQGTFGGNILPNTIMSGQNALLHGADILEADVAMNADGVLYMFHDGQEKYRFGQGKHISHMSTLETESLRGINSNGLAKKQGLTKLEDYLDYFKPLNCIINLDRCWDIWDSVLIVVKKHDMFDRIIFKSPPAEKYLNYVKKCKYPMVYMPIVRQIEDVYNVLNKSINIFGLELIYNNSEHDFLNKEFLEVCKSKDLKLWSNVIAVDDTDVFSAGHDDNMGILEGFNKHWGWQLEFGFDIIQTDWPALWHEYRNIYFKQNFKLPLDNKIFRKEVGTNV